LFDVYPSCDGMVVWIIDAAGRPHRVRYRYAPTLYVAGDRRALLAARQALARARMPVTLTPAVRQELMSGEEIPVTAVAVSNPLAFPTVPRLLSRVPGLTLYNCDILTARLFFYETGLFPLARCAVTCTGDEIREIALLSRPEDLEYDLPPLTVLRLRLESSAHHGDPDDLPAANPSHGRPGRLEVGVDGETVVLDGDDPAETIHSLNRLLRRYDPDVLLTEWGDPVLLPRLQALAARVGTPLDLNRDPVTQVRTRRSRSYMTYGQVVYQAGAQMLYGRWHIDLRNSFIFGESELAGLLEVARLARIPVQELARTSTGTAISSMQLQRAVRDGILIPWQKSEPEAFKTASQLIVTDKGGLTYQPLVGLYEQVGELDFSSMYPSMMARFNISPETIGCACCPDSRIPEIGYTVCRRRRGLVPQVLDHLLERRSYYKQRKQAATGPQRALYNQRQIALKWCLVTCLDGETLVPVRRDGKLQTKPIREIVDSYLPDGPGILPVDDLGVFGYDGSLHPIENPVKNVIKAPAPPKLLRVKLQSGREIRMIPDHRCFIVEENRLTVKRAAELRNGDLIPVVSQLPPEIVPIRNINVALNLLDSLPREEQPPWRVFGDALEAQVTKAYPDIRAAARGSSRTGKKTFLPFLLHANEMDVAGELARILREKFGLPSTLRKERKANMFVVQVNSVALARIFELVLGVGRSARHGKIDVPEILWNADDDGVDALEVVGEGVHRIKENGWLSRKHDFALRKRLKRVALRRYAFRKTITHGPFECLPIRTIEEVASTSPYTYCFEVQEGLPGFVVSGGVFTGNSFGYLGYRNARFGRIEAHEAVTAFAREMLLRAKEVAESRGFRMLHALVDSMWLQRPGATRADYEALAQAITGATGLSIFVEGIYRWLAFLPSKTHRGVGVPNRYLGVFDDNTTKVRGIEARRSDVPALVVQMQERMLARMFRCPTLLDVRAAMPEILGILEDALVRLRSGEVEAAELVVTHTLSQEVGEYRHNTVQAITARTLDRHGARLHPGEAVQFIITKADAKIPEDRVRPYALLGDDWTYDTEAYATLLLRAAATALELFGYSEDRLRREVWHPIRA